MEHIVTKTKTSRQDEVGAESYLRIFIVGPDGVLCNKVISVRHSTTTSLPGKTIVSKHRYLSHLFLYAIPRWDEAVIWYMTHLKVFADEFCKTENWI